MEVPILIIPGLGNSGPRHWQTLWEAANPNMRRVVQRDWDTPLCAEWIESLEEAVEASGPATVLVAHSLGTLLVAHWAAKTRLRIAAALLVAVPDPARPDFPAGVSGFAPVPLRNLPFRSTVVASTNDPYGGVGHAASCAVAWGSHFVDIGPKGHINADSGLGEWNEGYVLLEELLSW